MTTLYFILVLGFKIVTTKYLGEHFAVLSSPTLLSRSIKWYLSQETTLNDNCRMQLIDFASSLNKGRRWALEMYDAMGKLPSGILNGNFVDMGSFDECINIDEIRNDSTRLIGKYCLGLLSIPSEYVLEPWFLTTLHNIQYNQQIKQTEQLPNYVVVPTQMRFSVCFPNSCSAADIEEIEKGIGLNLTITEEVCQTKETQVQITVGGWVTLGLSVVILILMIASTIYELTWKGKPHWALKSFSVRTNGKLIFHIAKRDPNQVSCIHGLRTIAMIGVISCHVCFIRFEQPTRDGYYATYWSRQIKNMLLFNPILIVDIFFLISGFLVSYLFLQKSSRGYKFNFISHYLGRYLRLTPPVLVVLLFALTWYEYIGSGPVWNLVYDDINSCRRYWWSYLLYIQNWTTHLCISSTWYLSDDFQLFIFSPFLLIPLKRWPKATLVATSCLTLLSLLSTFVMVWIKKISGMTVSQVTFDYLTYYSYFLPMRASTWLIGFMLGYIIFASNRGQGKTVLKMRLAIPLFVAAVIVIIVCIFGTYHISISPYNRVETAMCLTLIRPAFAISLGYIIYCCHLGYIGAINTFLSNPLFEVLSRLSYTVYLIHNFVVIYNINSIRVAPFVTNFTFLVNDLPGVTFLSLILAIILSLSVELPAQHFVNCLVKRIQEMSLSK